MNREQALQLVRDKVQNENLISHMIATEAIMGALAKRLGGKEERWRRAGLLHDLDVEETAGRRHHDLLGVGAGTGGVPCYRSRGDEGGGR